MSSDTLKDKRKKKKKEFTIQSNFYFTYKRNCMKNQFFFLQNLHLSSKFVYFFFALFKNICRVFWCTLECLSDNALFSKANRDKEGTRQSLFDRKYFAGGVKVFPVFIPVWRRWRNKKKSSINIIKFDV